MACGRIWLLCTKDQIGALRSPQRPVIQNLGIEAHAGPCASPSGSPGCPRHKAKRGTQRTVGLHP